MVSQLCLYVNYGHIFLFVIIDKYASSRNSKHSKYYLPTNSNADVMVYQIKYEPPVNNIEQPLVIVKVS